MAYEEAGVQEYWLIDPNRQVAEFYQLDDNGRYHLAQLEKNKHYYSELVAGFWIDPSWFWRPTLPSTLTIMKELKII